jgi:hypothetical protein
MLLRSVCSVVLLLGIASAPSTVFAQGSGVKPVLANATNATVKVAPANAKKAAAGPFHGKLAAVDKVARTIVVGKRTFQVGPQTKITRNGQLAKLEEGMIGESCSGYVKPTEDGKWLATTVNFGQKPGAGGATKSGK